MWKCNVAISKSIWKRRKPYLTKRIQLPPERRVCFLRQWLNFILKITSRERSVCLFRICLHNNVLPYGMGKQLFLRSCLYLPTLPLRTETCQKRVCQSISTDVVSKQLLQLADFQDYSTPARWQHPITINTFMNTATEDFFYYNSHFCGSFSWQPI